MDGFGAPRERLLFALTLSLRSFLRRPVPIPEIGQILLYFLLRARKQFFYRRIQLDDVEGFICYHDASRHCVECSLRPVKICTLRPAKHIVPRDR